MFTSTRVGPENPGHSAEDLALTRSDASNTTNTVSKLTAVFVIVQHCYAAEICDIICTLPTLLTAS